MGHHLLVSHVMSREPLLLRADMRLEPAIQLLVDHRYSGAPTIDEHGRLMGMLHAIDIAAMHLAPAAHEPVSRPTGSLPAARSPAVQPSFARHVLVGEVCRAPVTIHPTRTVDDAAGRMRDHDTDRLAVIDGSEHVVGVLSGHDLLRAIIRRGDLLQEVVNERIIELGLHDVRAAVDLSGVVLLTGAVDSAATPALLVDAVNELDGVTEVDELLTVIPEHGD